MRKVIFILSGLALLGIGGFAYYSEQVKLLKNMKYDLISVNITGLQGNVITLTVKLKITSASSIEVQVNSLNLDLYLDGAYAGNTSSAGGFAIPAQGYNIVTFEINLQLPVVIGNVLSLIQSGDLNKSFDLEAKGGVSVSSGFIRVKMPVEFPYKFTIADLISKK